MKHRLAVAYDLGSFSPLEIVGAVGESCDLIWVVDSSQVLGPLGEMLARTGTIVDIAGLSSDDATDAVRVTRPHGIVAFSDAQLATASAISVGLRLRGNDPVVMRRFIDKYEQRAVLRAAGVTVPNFAAIPAASSAAEVIELAEEIAFPAVLKPRCGCSSRDTYHVESAQSLAEVLAPTRGSREAADEEYVVEEYLPGDGSLAARGLADYVSVESVVVAGRIRHLGVTGKFPLAEPYREIGNVMPCSLAVDEIESVMALVDKALIALGAEHGCFHTEVKLTPDGSRIIEANARVGGGGIEQLFVMSYGASLLRIAAMAALGIDPPARLPLRSEVVAYQFHVLPPCTARRLDLIEGLDKVSAMPGIVQLDQKRQVGDETDWRLGSLEYVVSIRGSVADHDELTQVRARILEQLDLAYS